MQSANRTRFLAVNYPNLQGLKQIPPGLALLLVTLWANGQSFPAHQLYLPALFLVGSFALVIPINRYYDQLFGRVKRNFASLRFEVVAGAIAGLVVLCAFWAETAFTLSVSPLGLSMALVLLFMAARMWRKVNPIFFTGLCSSVLMAAVSILPPLGVSCWWSAVGMKNHIFGVTIIFSLIMIVSGILGHIYFAYSLPSAPETVNE
jgi:hypothetical protein